jgi:dihydrodipicolinate synthase/N-acetylneuraminate lyase
MATLPDGHQRLLHDGAVIPAHPLALSADRRLDERRQRALTRYYLDAGAGGVAVGVHTTQFAIREVGLLRPVLSLAAEEVAARSDRAGEVGRPVLLIAGAVGPVRQAVREAEGARELGYHLALLSPGGLADHSEAQLLDRARAVAEVIPVFGFYLQPAVGGRRLSYAFWREFAEIPGVMAIKIAPFDRYGTLDVVRAVCASSRRDEIALYTGNDDAIVADLLTPFDLVVDGDPVRKWVVGGLLGQWAVGTRAAVDLLERVKRVRRSPDGRELQALLSLGARLTDLNAAVFDAAHGFAGVIAGVHEVLRAQGLLEGIWCLDPDETLSPGQREELERVRRSYPELGDDDFVAERLAGWLA